MYMIGTVNPFAAMDAPFDVIESPGYAERVIFRAFAVSAVCAILAFFLHGVRYRRTREERPQQQA
jgi:hypothetical protein